MIGLKQPSIAVHSYDVPGYKYEMQHNFTLPMGSSANIVVATIRAAAWQNPDHYLYNAVINCHGGPGELYIGGADFSPLNETAVAPFARMKNEVGRIWLVACEVVQGMSKRKGPEGLWLCAALAVAVNCEVVAARRSQSVNQWFSLRHPKNHIDRFEGKTYLFSPDGTYCHWYPVSDSE